MATTLDILTVSHMIVGGPSREALFDSCRLQGDMNQTVFVDYKDDGRTRRISLKILKIHAETSGKAGQFWHCQARVTGSCDGRQVEFYYDSQLRTGSILLPL